MEGAQYTNTHLIAHLEDAKILIAEHDSAPDEYGYQLADVESFPAHDDATVALAAHGYSIAEGWFEDLTSGIMTARVERRQADA